MGNRKDVKSLDPRLLDPVMPETEELEATDDLTPAGRIIHDSRGNAVWKWVGDTSSTATGSGILKHLDANDLKVDGQGERFVAPRTSGPSKPDAGGGYDPYNQSTPRVVKPTPKKGRSGR